MRIRNNRNLFQIETMSRLLCLLKKAFGTVQLTLKYYCKLLTESIVQYIFFLLLVNLPTYFIFLLICAKFYFYFKTSFCCVLLYLLP